jgi:FKBP-type peptidyl-prolyl cis-trans isomerase
MKRIVLVAVLIVLLVATYAWFSHREAPAPPMPASPVPVAQDPKLTERETLFGAAALAPEIEWRSNGLGIHIVNAGAGAKPGIGAQVRLIYTGRLKDGTVFDQSDKPSAFLIGATIPGLSVGLQTLGTGGKAVFFIPPSLGYGHRKVLGIPADSGLIFDVQVVDVAQ